jgi:WhiB family redox-sensing transcriptional regulator
MAKVIEQSDIEAFESVYGDPFHDDPAYSELVANGSNPGQEPMDFEPPTLTWGGNAEWMDDALCAQTDPEAYYPEEGNIRLAKLICSRCAVRDECLDAALQGDEPYGIWGGLSTRERNRLKPRNSRD